MHVLLVKPKALYLIMRFADACRRHGWDLTLLETPKRGGAHYLISFRDDAYDTVEEIPVAGDDVDAVAPFLARYDAVIPAWEYAVLFAERLSAKLGLFHNPLERIEAYRSKYLMREYFAEAGVSQPRLLARFQSMQEVNGYDWSAVTFPIIVKPLDMSASLYVRLCHDAESAKKIYQRIFKYSQSFAGIAFSAQGLLEEAVLGPEYSAECVVERGEIAGLFQTTKFVSPYPACDEIGHLSGEPFADGIGEQVERAVRGIVAAWRVESAVMHVEYKVCGGVVKIIEAACRIGGDMISEIVERRHGVSLEECLLMLRARRPVAPALERRAASDAAHGYAIKYLYAENLDAPVPAEVEILRRSLAPGAAERSASGFGVENRLGHVLARSRSLDALKRYVGDAGASVSAISTDRAAGRRPAESLAK